MKKTLLLLSCLLVSNITFSKKYIAKFEFNGNANDQFGKIQTNVHGATLTTDRHGRENSAYQFDGTDDFIEIPKGIMNVRDNGSFSVETFALINKNYNFWTDNEGIDRYYVGGSIFSVFGSPFKSSDLLLIWHDNNNFIASHRTDPLGLREDILHDTNKNDFYDKYHHIVLVRNGKKRKLKLYIDGKLISKKDLGPAKEIKEFPSLIGAHNAIIQNSKGESEIYKSLFLKGKLDYLRIYNRALSSKKVRRKFRRESRTPYEHDYKSKNECKAKKHYTDKINRSIKIYPNPSRGRINITADANIDCKEIRIYNHHGKVVFRSSYLREINAHCLKPGHYTVVLITPLRNYKRRLVIIR